MGWAPNTVVEGVVTRVTLLGGVAMPHIVPNTRPSSTKLVVARIMAVGVMAGIGLDREHIHFMVASLRVSIIISTVVAGSESYAH